MNESKYLVSYEKEGETVVSLEPATGVIMLTDMLDIIDVSNVRVSKIISATKIEPLTYVGWQPDCLIEYVDRHGKVEISGYGTEH